MIMQPLHQRIKKKLDSLTTKLQVKMNKKTKRSLKQGKKILTKLCGGVGPVIKYSAWRTYVSPAIISSQTINVNLMRFWSKSK